MKISSKPTFTKEAFMIKKNSACLLILISALFITHCVCAAQEAHWPKRVLLTNDNGLEDVKLIELARAFAPVAETWVVAPLEDKSGSTHYLSVSKTGKLTVERRDLGIGIRAYGVDGFPADCIVLALAGLMRETPPDLVISGINGGPNLAHDWLGSGTIGAARMAAYFGVPAIAVSGLDDDVPGSVAAATRWVVELARNSWVRELQPSQYLTVSMPRILPAEIKGVRIAKRAGLLVDVAFEKESPSDLSPEQETWVIKTTWRENTAFGESDASLYQGGYIVIVPMRADEHDYGLLDELQEGKINLPSWPPQ
jgi:5'-nucleotidase